MQRERTEPLISRPHLPIGAVFAQPLPATHNAFVYVYRGALAIGDRRGPTCSAWRSWPTRRPATAWCCARSTRPTRALLIAGRPLHEPIAQYGPFVMNTREQLMEAVQDYQSGRLAA